MMQTVEIDGASSGASLESLRTRCRFCPEEVEALCLASRYRQISVVHLADGKCVGKIKVSFTNTHSTGGSSPQPRDRGCTGADAEVEEKVGHVPTFLFLIFVFSPFSVGIFMLIRQSAGLACRQEPVDEHTVIVDLGRG